MNSDPLPYNESSTLCVAGLVYFEVFLPRNAGDIPLGRELFVDDIGVGLGGALNCASVAAALGVDTTLAHPQGRGHTDAAVTAELQRLALNSLTWTADDDPAISLVRSDSGDRGFASRANYEALQHCPPLANYDWVHAPGLEEAERLDVRLKQARDSGATVSVSGSWAPERLDALSTHAGQPRWDVLILNHDEAHRATGKQPARAPELLQHVADDVIVTAGSDAVYARIDGADFELDVPRVDDFVDATGAGDAFCAGYITGQLQSCSPDEALELAVNTAADIVRISGGVIRDARLR